ncbi:MAG: amidohydrolase family protein [Thermoanaerobacteraceae bacterium]|nr:amidohydrolase family protein [Thermoanaerobacteraceae bacterium]
MDILIKNGRAIDPSLNMDIELNIGIENGRIAYIGMDDIDAEHVINATGKIVAPGFIDIHMHEDPLVDGEIGYDIAWRMASMGVTTAVGGNCGISPIDVGEYLDTVDKDGSPVNFALYIGHQTLREAVGLTDVYKAADFAQVEAMKPLVRRALEDGALGVSLGLEYTPGASTYEAIELIKLAGEYKDKLSAAHFRFDVDRGVEAIKELSFISEVTEVPMQVSHIGSCLAYGCGYMQQGLSLLEEKRRYGIDLMADCYPYNASCTTIGSAVFDENYFKKRNNGYESILVTEGKYKGLRCNEDIFNDLRMNYPDTIVISFNMDMEEVNTALKHPLVMVASDGLMKDGQGHPRAAGTFARVLRFVREGLMNMKDAIYKMSTMPAERLKLKDRGSLIQGNWADIVVFDPDSIADMATYEDPALAPVGMDYVIINGRFAVENGKLTKDRPGRSIRK